MTRLVAHHDVFGKGQDLHRLRFRRFDGSGLCVDCRFTDETYQDLVASGEYMHAVEQMAACARRLISEEASPS